MPRSRFSRRGEGYVVIQFVLLALVIAGPTHVSGWPTDAYAAAPAARMGAIVLVALGALLLVAGTRELGANLTPLPYPKAESTLVRRGVYRWVRHPLYGGLMLLAFGWSLRRGGVVPGYAALLTVLLVVKSRVEETWLLAKHAGYADYRLRTRRFIPFLW